MMTRLYAKLEERGVAVETYVPTQTDVERERPNLEARVAANDIVLHSGSMVRVAGRPKRWRGFSDKANEMATLMDTVIGLDNAHKSHSLGEPVDRFDLALKLQAAGIPIPRNMTIDDYRNLERSVPVVLKSRVHYVDVDAMFIDEPEQLENYLIPASFNIGKMIAAAFQNQPKFFYVQDFVETPSDRFTTYELFTVGDEVLGAVLYVSRFKKEQQKERDGYRLIHSQIPKRSYPIAVSHQAEDAYTNTPLIILENHGIDPNSRRVPTDLDALARDAGRELAKLGFVFGTQTWIQDNDGKFYFLDADPLSRTDMFNTLYLDGIGKPSEYSNLGMTKLADALVRYTVPQTH